MKKINIGFIGAGFVSQLAHVPNYYFDGRANVKAICDLNKKLCEKVADKYGIPNRYLSYSEMIQKENLDGVVLVVQRNRTSKITRQLLKSKSKFSLLTEKPIAQNYNEAKKLCILAKKNKINYFVGFMKRHDNGVNYLKKNLMNFKLGQLNTVYYESFDGDSYCNPTDYFKVKKNKRNKELNNSLSKYLNAQCHSIDLLRYLFGELKLLNSLLTIKGEGMILLKSKKNIPIILNNQFTKSKTWNENIKFNFDKGCIEVKLPPPFLKNTPAQVLIKNYKTGRIIKPFIKWGWSFKNQASAFISYLKSRKKTKNLTYAKDCLDDIKIIENAFKNNKNI